MVGLITQNSWKWKSIIEITQLWGEQWKTSQNVKKNQNQPKIFCQVNHTKLEEAIIFIENIQSWRA